jgi:hypothetical protein
MGVNDFSKAYDSVPHWAMRLTYLWNWTVDASVPSSQDTEWGEQSPSPVAWVKVAPWPTSNGHSFKEDSLFQASYLWL